MIKNILLSYWIFVSDIEVNFLFFFNRRSLLFVMPSRKLNGKSYDNQKPEFSFVSPRTPIRIFTWFFFQFLIAPRNRRRSLSSVSSISSDEGNSKGGRRLARNRSPPQRGPARRPFDNRLIQILW